ncbi:MAG: hypothetical protein ACTIH2_01230 [Anaerococcus sp.]
MKKGLFTSLFEGIIDEFPSDITSKRQKAKEFEKNKTQMKNKVKKPEKYLWESRENNIRQTYTKPKKEHKYQVDKKAGSRIKMTRSEMKKAIVYSEILGKPKAFR